MLREFLVRFLLGDPRPDAWPDGISRIDDWTTCAALAERWGTIPRFRERLSSSGVRLPDTVRSDVERRFRDGYARSVLQARAGVNVCAAFQQENLSAVAFKGLASIAMLHGGLEHRVIADADLLIQEADLRRARVVLEELGFRPEIDCELATYVEFIRRAPGFGGNEVLTFHHDCGGTIDLHWRLGSGLDPAAMIERSKPVALMGSIIRVVAPEDGALVCAHHCLRNHFSPDYVIRDLLDLELWCKRIAESGCIEATVHRARACGLATPLLVLTSILEMYDQRAAGATVASALSRTASPQLCRSAARLRALFTLQVREAPLDRELLYLFRMSELRKILAGILFGGRRHLRIARSMDTVLAGRPMGFSTRLVNFSRSIRRLRPHHVPLLRALARSKDVFAQAPVCSKSGLRSARDPRRRAVDDGRGKPANAH